MHRVRVRDTCAHTYVHRSATMKRARWWGSWGQCGEAMLWRAMRSTVCVVPPSSCTVRMMYRRHTYAHTYTHPCHHTHLQPLETVRGSGVTDALEQHGIALGPGCEVVMSSVV